MLRILATLCALAIAAPAVLAAEGSGNETYDVLFKNGTLDDIPEGAELIYSRSSGNPVKPELSKRDTGDIALTVTPATKPVAHLEFTQFGGQKRNLGSFPASVGNPMIMYFYETVVRDMAEISGGSPFYIRNRVKDSLIQPADITTGEAEFDGKTIPITTVKIHPFADDPNADRMMGFGDLELIVQMSDEVPGWYLSLTAAAPDPKHSDAWIYLSQITFKELETAQ